MILLYYNYNNNIIILLIVHGNLQFAGYDAINCVPTLVIYIYCSSNLQKGPIFIIILIL